MPSDGFPPMVFREMQKGAAMNKEPLFTNNICKRYEIQRHMKIHHDMMQHQKSVTKPLCGPPKRLKFMKLNVSKKFQVDEEKTEILRQNVVLLRALAKIQTESIESRMQKRLNSGFQVKKSNRKEEARKREARKIARENVEIMQRLYSCKPVYELKEFKKKAKVFAHFRKLRSNDHTSGHLFPSPADLIQQNTKKRDKGKKIQLAPLSKSRHGSTVSKKMANFRVDEKELNELMENSLQLRQHLEDLKKATRGELFQSRPTKLVKKLRAETPRERGTTESKEDSDADSIQMRYVNKDAHGNYILTVEDQLNGPESQIEEKNCMIIDNTMIDVLHDAPVYVSTEEDAEVTCWMRIYVLDPFDGFFHITLKDSEGSYNATLALEDVEELNKIARKRSNEEEVARIYKTLSSLFREADVNNKGVLKYNEFIKIMQRLDLGFKPAELRSIISEVDENEDGYIDYNEFVPVAVEMIQSFRAREDAKKTVEDTGEKMDLETFEELNSADLYKCINIAVQNFENADKRNTGLLKRQKFRECISDERCLLTEVERKRIMAGMPMDDKNNIHYGKFKEVYTEVRYQTLRNNIANAKASDLEIFLMDLCKAAEKHRIGKAHTPDDEVPFEGLIPVRDFTKILLNTKSLILTKVQVACLLCDAEVMDGMIDYWRFVPIAASVLENMFSVDFLTQRAELLKSTSSVPLSLISGDDPEEVEAQLYRIFKLHDEDNSGTLDSKEFMACLQSLDLGLTISEIEALLTSADKDEDHQIDYEEFIKFSYENLVTLGREKYLRDICRAKENESKSPTSFSSMLASTIGEDEGVDSDNNEKLSSQSQNSSTKEGAVNTAKISEKLYKLFETADKNKKGFLTAGEFRAVLDSMELGITPFQQMLIMAEADENADNMIQYDEFVPICVELLQAFRAKSEIDKTWDDLEKEAERAAIQDFQMQETEMRSTIQKAMNQFTHHDSLGKGRLSRTRLREVLNSRELDLPRSEVNLIMASLPDGSKDNTQCKDEEPANQTKEITTDYTEFPRIFETVRKNDIKRRYMHTTQPSDLEAHLLQLFREEESKDTPNFQVKNNKMTRKRTSIPGNNDSAQENGPLETALFTNLLPIQRIRSVLENSKHLHLNRRQLLSIMALSDIEGGDSSLINYRKFASHAAKMINKLCDVNEVKVRAEIMAGLEGKAKVLSKERFETDLRSYFMEFDTKRDGLVTFPVLLMCLQKIDNLSLESADYAALGAMVPRDSENRVQWEEFLRYAYDDIIYILREKSAYKSMDQIGTKSSSSLKSTDPLFFSRKEQLHFTGILLRDAHFSVLQNKLMVRPGHSLSEDRDQASSPNSKVEGASSTINLQEKSPMDSARENGNNKKTPREAAEIGSVNTAGSSSTLKSRSTILFSCTREISIKCEKGSPRKMEASVKVLQGQPMIGSYVDIIVEQAPEVPNNDKSKIGGASPSSKYSTSTFNEEDAYFEEESFEGNASINEKDIVSTTVKLPSIALADLEKARSFAENICKRIRLVESIDGNLSIFIEEGV